MVDTSKVEGFFLLGDVRLRTLPFPVRRPTFSEVKRVHSKLATLYHPLLVNDAAKQKPRVVETPLVPCEAVTSVHSIANTNSVPSETSDKIVVQVQEDVDYPDTRIKLQLDSAHKEPIDNKNGLHFSTCCCVY